MRQILLFVSVMVILSVWYIYAIEPNCVRSVIHDVDGASNKLISSDYTDGLGRTIQSKL